MRQLGIGEAAVIAVNADSPVLDALSLMSKHAVSSVAVLGHMGVVLGNISMTDVKVILHFIRQNDKCRLNYLKKK